MQKFTGVCFYVDLIASFAF